MDKERVIRWTVAISVPAVILALYIVVMVSFQQQTVAAPVTFPAVVRPDDSGQVNLRIVTVDPLARTMTFEVGFVPSTFSASIIRPGRDVFNTSFTVTMNSKVFTFAAGAVASPIQFVVPLTSGSITRYPLGEYVVKVAISLYEGPVFAVADFDPQITVYTSPVFGFSFATVMNNATTDNLWGEKFFTVTASRTALFQVYPVFVIIAFLVITVLLIINTIVIGAFEYRKIEGPVFALSGSLIFALPALRNTVPQGPPIGSLLDYCSFFWAMVAAVVNFAVIVFRYIDQSPPAPAPAPARPADIEKPVGAYSTGSVLPLLAAPQSSPPSSQSVYPAVAAPLGFTAIRQRSQASMLPPAAASEIPLQAIQR